MKSKVYVTGIGIVSAIGLGKDEHMENLWNGETGLRSLTHLSTVKQGLFPAGEVPLTDTELYDKIQNLGIRPDHQSRTLLLGTLALEEALEQAGEKVLEGRVGFIGASSVGGLRQTETYYEQYKHGGVESRRFQTHDAADCIEEMARVLGIDGFVTNINTACASATHAIILGSRMIRAGLLDTVIVGGADALTKVTINGFDSLFLLAKDHCRPFDRDRSGINLGEGAGFLVLQSDKSRKRSGSQALATISGFGVRNDAYHATSTSPNARGLTAAMSEALLLAELRPTEIDYVNAHGTATPNNDLTEGVALQRVFGERMPYFSSTKAFTGHTLAAAGAIEGIFSILALQHQVIPPNLNFEHPIEQHGLVPQQESITAKVEHTMSNSMGMGGYCSTVIFSKI